MSLDKNMSYGATYKWLDFSDVWPLSFELESYFHTFPVFLVV